jgi:hypothetical protein
VISTKITDNGWVCGSNIVGSVSITSAANNPDTSTSPGYWDIGFADPNYCGATQFDPTPGNTIGGSVSFNKNSSGGAIANNDIRQNLVCSGNNPPPTGANKPGRRQRRRPVRHLHQLTAA